MKKRMFPLIASLLLLSLMVVIIAQTSSVQIGPYGNLKIGPYGNLKIGPYGNLVGLTDTQGKEVLSQIREGFEIAYRVKNPNGDSEVRAAAIGDQPTKGLIIEGKRSTDFSKVVTTSDKALEITTQFSFDEKAQVLIIDRRVTNISGGTVDLQMTRAYVDAKLVQSGPSQTKKQPAAGRIRAGRRDPYDCERVGKCDPPPPPPCGRPICPFPGYLPPQLIGEGNQFTLEWKDGTNLAPKGSGGAARPANEAQFLIHIKM